ncbi:MAG: tryptophan 2,3-dioxygenase family protein [Bacteroidia bacterium]|jgi:tryptophan 2,3-dioxygenase|nr:tryptophan 2,3-dioxygenase family protein [Bacteroidia bacterium]
MNTPDNEVIHLLERLQTKYNASGQDLKAYLEGLLHAEYLNYWDYVEVDTLLTLQKPRTAIKDELIFIIYHQITELYFKLTLHEMEQIAQQKEQMTAAFMVARLNRMNAYFRNLTLSFEIMIQGMEKEQFLQFRMSLLPASGFQSAQYRMIEICATSFYNLVDKEHRDKVKPSDGFEKQYEYIYWKAGATELATGKKTLTLTQFEDRYSDRFKRLAQQYATTNLWVVYHALPEAEKGQPELIAAMRSFDEHVNIHWPLVHYKSAARYLQRNPEDIAATGGTNWQKYLPPRFQKRIFYPELWSEEEKENWGRAAFM